jgi:hypothetical protein
MSKLSKRGEGKEKESKLLITAVIVLFLVLNLLFAYLANTYGWYFLATDPMFYTLSGVTDEYFEKVNPEGKRAEFYFCMSPDGLRENNTFGRILDTVKQFDERYEFFTMTHLDTYYDYETLARFSKDSEGNDIEINNQSIIVYSPDAGTEPLVRSLSTFYYYDTEDTTNDDMIFNGEEVVASLVGAALTPDRPEALFTLGHGEAPTASFMNAFYSAGYEVTALDLASNNIPEATELIIIASPKYDFDGTGVKDTIKALNKKFVEENDNDGIVIENFSEIQDDADREFLNMLRSATENASKREAEGRSPQVKKRTKPMSFTDEFNLVYGSNKNKK